MAARALALALCLAAAGCGRLDYQPVSGSAGDDAGGPPGALGDECSPAARCGDGLACVRSYCNCVAEVEGDEFQTCALRADGAVWCSGANANGELGDGTTDPSLAPVRVKVIADAVDHDLGAYHACARDAAGQPWCWGRFDADEPRLVPELLAGAPPLTRLASGGFHACFVSEDRTVWCVGQNSRGQLGQGITGEASDTPVKVPLLGGVVAIGAGGFHTCAATEDGALWCWGLDDHGQIGAGAIAGDRPSPTQVVDLTDVTAVTAGDWYTCALRGDGTVWCWGENDRGQTGDVTTGADQLRPRQVTGLGASVALVYAGDDHACALDADGAVYCWGAGTAGQIGDGDAVDVAPPTRVTDLPPAVDLALGRSHTCAVTRDGDTWCWGSNSQGQHGAGAPGSSPTPRLSAFGCR